MSKNKEKVSSKEVGLEIGLVISRFLYKTEHLHYGYWPDELAIIPENVGKAQDLHSKLIIDTIPEDVETILDIGSGSGGLAEKLIDKVKIWFMPTGWRPKDVEKRFPLRQFDDPFSQIKYSILHDFL